MVLCGPLWSFVILCGPLRYLVRPLGVPLATHCSECIRLSLVSFRVFTKIIFKVATKLFIFHDLE